MAWRWRLVCIMFLVSKGGEQMSTSEDEFSYRYALGCIRAYLEGKQTENWVMSMIRGTNIRGRVLADILNQLQPSAVPERYEKLLSLCRNEGRL